jgi:salicylate hydroxylase
MGPGRHLVAYPLRGGELINFVAVEERASWTQEGWTHPDDPARLRAAFAGWAPEVTGLLAAVEETFLWGLFDHAELPEWVAGRLALLGDACHPMLPFLAQGATMALEDAWVLAAELDLAEDPAGGLMAYEARRKRRATRVQRAAARNGRIYHFAVPGARQFLHLGMRAVSAVAPGALIGRFDWLYGGDVVSADPRD